jgi:hypothetical protein
MNVVAVVVCVLMIIFMIGAYGGLMFWIWTFGYDTFFDRWDYMSDREYASSIAIGIAVMIFANVFFTGLFIVGLVGIGDLRKWLVDNWELNL